MSEVPLQDPRAVHVLFSEYRGTSLVMNTALIGPYSSPMPRDLW